MNIEANIEAAYEELGVAPGASEAEVKAAWRRLVSRWHPDRNPSADAAALIQRINGAYDRIRLSRADGDDAEPAAPDRVLRRRVRVTLEQAAFGCTRVLRGRLVDSCSRCDGEGRLAAQACARCGGAGATRGALWFGWLPLQAACSACDGSGQVRPRCEACAGEGSVATRYRCTVRLPAGLSHGDVLNASAGGADSAGFDGALELQIEITRHRFFHSDADGTLRCDMPVDGFAWLAEAWVAVPSLSGPQQMRLRRGRTAYRLRGQGMPLAHESALRGDCVVTVTPLFPDTLDARQQALLDELAAGTRAGPAPAVRAWQLAMRAWEKGRS